MVKVSVIIPVYNGDRYLSQAIDSICQQTYQDYEIIVIDDGSTDQTKQVINKYIWQIRYIYQQNQGVAAARNRGLKEAKGELIAFLDQDDYFLPNKLALQVELLEKQNHLGFVNSGWQTVNDKGEILSTIKPWIGLPKLDLEALLIWKPVFLGAMLFRSSWLEKIGGFNQKLEQTPDVELVMRLAIDGCLAGWVEQITVNYRQHQRNVSRNSLQQAEELQTVLEEFFNQPNLPKEAQKLAKQSIYQSLVWSGWRFYDTGNVAKMAEYLEKSLLYRKKTVTETIFDWIEYFKNYAGEYGYKLDVYSLSKTQEWQELIKKCGL